MGRTRLFSRDEVLDDAIQIFWKQGFKDTSLLDIERATGVNKSGLYSEFKDKDDLFTAGLKRYLVTTKVLEILDREPVGWGNLRDFLLIGIRCKGQPGCWVSNSLREFPTLPKSARTTIESHLAKVRQALERNLSAVECLLAPEDAADVVLNFNGGLALKMNLGRVEGVERQVELFLSLLGMPQAAFQPERQQSKNQNPQSCG